MNIYQVWADERNGMVPSGTLRAAYLDKRIAELEAELAYRYRRHAADVEERDRKIAELRKDIKRLETNNSNLER